MRNYYLTFLGFLFACIQAYGQSFVEAPPLQNDLTEQPAPRITAMQNFGNRTLLWSEDFSSGFDSPNGTWTTEGANADVWRHTGTVDSACYSGTGDDAVNFTTRENGFMIFHGDSVNCVDPVPDPPVITQESLEGELISPALDFTDESAILVTFEQRFRHCCGADFELLFSVSVDGGENWEDYDVRGDTPVNLFNENTSVSLNISPVAANQSEVFFKFTWNASNTSSHYFWALDDILVEIPVDVDVAISDVKYQQWDLDTSVDYADLKHTIFKNTQVRPLNLQATAVNNGGTIQNGVYLNTTINTPAGPISLDSDPQNIGIGETGIFEIPYTPADNLGTYTIAYEMVTESPDENPMNNADTLSFEVDDVLMARDDRSRSGVFSNYVDELRAALAYTLTADDVVYGISVALDNSSDLGTFFNAQLLNVDLDFLAETETAIVEESMLNATGDENFASLTLETPYSAVANESLFPAFVHFGGADEANIATSGFCPDQTCFVWASIESNGQECDPCFFNTKPMIRLELGFVNSIEGAETIDGVRLGQNVPNPAKDYTIVGFELNQTTPDVRFEIYDLGGRLINQINAGTLPAGEHTEILDTSTMNPGVYLYTLVAGNNRQTKRMTVVQ